MSEHPDEDPGFAELLGGLGATHRPGMAQELLAELAPLLAVEGIDLDDPDGVGNVEEFEAAFARAVEQHNMTLMNPVTTELESTEKFLVEFTELVARNRTRDAERTVDLIEPEATPGRPAASHVIGFSLGLLDRWHSDAVLGDSFTRAMIPKWRGPAKTTARQLLAYARNGDAYAATDSLLFQHGGQFVMHSALLAIAATITAHASNRGLDIAAAASELFAHHGVPSTPGSAFGLAKQAHSTVHEDYQAWLSSGPEAHPQETETEMIVFSALTHAATAAGVNLEDPDAIDPLLDALFEFYDRETIAVLLGTLDSYIHFRLEQAPGDWDHAHELVAEAIVGLEPGGHALLEAIDASSKIPDAQRRMDLEAIPALAGVPALLDWVGDSRPVTQTGNLRRADIAPAALLFGVHAEGVAKLPPPGSSDSLHRRGSHSENILHVQSMLEVPVLAPVWRALQILQVLEVNSVSAKPGPRKEHFFGPDSGADQLEMLAAVVVSQTLASAMDQESGGFHLRLIDITIARMIEAITPGVTDSETRARPLAGNHLEYELAQAGLLTHDEDGDIVITPSLVGAVGTGILMTISFLDETLE